MIENAITDSRKRVLCIHTADGKEQFLSPLMADNQQWMRLHGWVIKTKAEKPKQQVNPNPQPQPQATQQKTA